MTDFDDNRHNYDNHDYLMMITNNNHQGDDARQLVHQPPLFREQRQEPHRLRSVQVLNWFWWWSGLVFFCFWSFFGSFICSRRTRRLIFNILHVITRSHSTHFKQICSDLTKFQRIHPRPAGRLPALLHPHPLRSHGRRQLHNCPLCHWHQVICWNMKIKYSLHTTNSPPFLVKHVGFTLDQVPQPLLW